jgi:hypothetical protein
VNFDGTWVEFEGQVSVNFDGGGVWCGPRGGFWFKVLWMRQQHLDEWFP